MNEYSVDIPIVENEPISRHQLPSHFARKSKSKTVIDPANA